MKKWIKRFFGSIRIIDFLVYLVFLFIMVFAISNKVNYHVDETLSYGLANYTDGYFISLKEGYRYEPASDPFIKYLSVQPGNRSNLSIAWSNQANDSHPPFYYALVHIVSALKVGTFSKWYAGSINIFFALLTLFVIRKIIGLFTDDHFLKTVISFGFTLNYGIASGSTLFRMYFMSMFLVALTTYIVLLHSKKQIGKIFWPIMIFVVYVGALTHYYCLLYDIIISTVYCVYLLTKKQYKDVIYYCVCMTIAAALTISTFPPIVRHLFSTGHANDAFSGIKTFSDYGSRIAICFNEINKTIFGKLLWVLLIVYIASLIYLKTKQNEKLFSVQHMILLLPSLLYFVLVGVTATYTNERYFTPIYGTLFCAILTFLLINICKIIKIKQHSSIVCVILVLICTVSGYINAEWPYLYKQDLEYLNNAEKYADSDCICFHDELKLDWEIQLNFNEFIKYNSFTLFDKNDVDLSQLNDFIKTDNVVINLTCIDNETDYLQEILNNLPQFNSFEKIGGNGNGTSYYLY